MKLESRTPGTTARDHNWSRSQCRVGTATTLHLALNLGDNDDTGDDGDGNDDGGGAGADDDDDLAHNSNHFTSWW